MRMCFIKGLLTFLGVFAALDAAMMLILIQFSGKLSRQEEAVEWALMRKEAEEKSEGHS